MSLEVILDFQATDLFAQVACRLGSDPKKPRWVKGLTADVVLLQNADRSLVVVLRYRDESSEAIAAKLKAMRKSMQVAAEFVLVGGDKKALRILKKSAPAWTTKRQAAIHVDDSGEVWSNIRTPVAKQLRSDREPIDAARVKAFVDGAESGATQAAAEALEHQRFQSVITQTRPVATMTILVAIGLFYLAETGLGGSEIPPVLWRLGALYGPSVTEGEVWRLFSVSVLHIGVMHLAFNALVLWRLGSFLERLVGSFRFIIIFGASVLLGSIASTVVLGGLAAGASGGLWGVLAAQAVLAFLGRGALPAAMIPGARQAALINLGLNVAASFYPSVDWAAHAGGGVAGALITLVFLRGLPRVDDDSVVAVGPSIGVRIAAGVFATLWALSLVLAVVVGKPWILASGPAYQRLQLPSQQVSAELPSGLAMQPIQEGREGVAIGSFERDAAACAIRTIAVEVDPPDALALDVLSASLAETEKALAVEEKIVAPTKRHKTAETEYGIMRTRMKSGVHHDVAFVAMPGRLARIECLGWPSLGWLDVTQHAAATLQPLP